MRLLADLTPPRPELLSVQADNLTLMREAVHRSRTCTALHPYADSLTPEGLEKVPLTTRDRLAEWSADPRTPNRVTEGDIRLVLRSSGSSGRVRTLLHDRPFNERVEALGARGLCTDGLGTNPFVLNSLAPGDLFGGFGFADAVLSRRGAAVLPAGTSMPAPHLAELITDLGVGAMVGLPGYVERLLAEIPAAMRRLRTLYYLGERMTGPAADALAAAGCAVRSFAYSTTETGPIGYQCAHLTGSDHHVHEDLVIAEVVDDDGRRLPDGVPGALAVTVLADTGTALVRYLVGDHATLRPSDCPCGSTARVLRIGARDDVSANLDGTLVTRSMFDTALDLPADARYQVAFNSRRGLLRLTLRGAALRGLTDEAARSALGRHQTLRKVVGSARFAGLTVDAGTAPYLTPRAKAPFFWSEEDRDDQA
ncbi:phenylacetate--CoA ligase family protein [Streptomyces sp. NPDC016640]|uniref:phenylacetate--CoA ligase family protein n=1 Tax=Streptomyces sp. NPDC016640 TaxID=3364969 RepID=UPI0036F94389